MEKCFMIDNKRAFECMVANEPVVFCPISEGSCIYNNEGSTLMTNQGKRLYCNCLSNGMVDSSKVSLDNVLYFTKQ